MLVIPVRVYKSLDLKKQQQHCFKKEKEPSMENTELSHNFFILSTT